MMHLEDQTAMQDNCVEPRTHLWGWGGEAGNRIKKIKRIKKNTVRSRIVWKY